jgi:hypothetical protein
MKRVNDYHKCCKFASPLLFRSSDEGETPIEHRCVIGTIRNELARNLDKAHDCVSCVKSDPAGGF